MEPRFFLYGDENGAAGELPMHGVDMDLQVMGRTKKQTNTGAILLPRASPLKKFFDSSKSENCSLAARSKICDL